MPHEIVSFDDEAIKGYVDKRFPNLTPYATAFHREPSQRSCALLPDDVTKRVTNDCELLKTRWLLNGWPDLYYNPNLDSHDPYFRLRW